MVPFSPSNIVYVLYTNFISICLLPTRPGYECPGARAVFKADGSILEIFVSSSGTFVKPGDDEWEHAKWVWKTSVLFQVTISV